MSEKEKAVSNYKPKNEVVLQGVPADLKDTLIDALSLAYPTLNTEAKGDVATSFGAEAIMGTDVWSIVHIGRLPRPLLEQMEAFGKGYLYAVAV